MTKLNKGEWGEPYVALRLAGDGRLYISDENGNKIPDEWMNVLEVIRRETAERTVTYGRDPETTMVTVKVNGDECMLLPASDFLVAANTLAADIGSGKGSSFDVSESVQKFLSIAEFLHMKAKSKDKSDIYLTTLDPRTSIQRQEIGFSVKTKFGQNPTLFNTARASAVRYRLPSFDRARMEKVNGIVNDKGHAAVMDRCEEILAGGCSPVYDGYALARRAGCEVFKDNLDLIDPRLPIVIERLLWNHFFGAQTSVDLPVIVQQVVEQNPCDIARPEVKYPYMVKAFLYAAYCGMTASTFWDGRAEVNGGFITVDENGQVLAHYALESEAFKGYLYNNCYLEFPSTGKDHGDYAYVYEVDGDFYFNLNFQIRYR